MTATLKINRTEREMLHWLMCRRLFVLGQDPPALARAEGVGTDQLGEELGEDLRLMQDLGWDPEFNGEGAELTMPRESLIGTLRRLRRDARRAPREERREREPQESAAERWERFRPAVATCERLLARLDSPADDDAAPTCAVSPMSATEHELGPYMPVSDSFILAAAERAERHEQEDTALTSVLTEHLGFEPVPATNRHLYPRLEGLRRAGLLTVTERRGEPFWGLTVAGREKLADEREAGALGELPESPQHRAWRHARVEAAVRIEAFRQAQAEALEAADELLNRYRPSMSREWFELSERLRWSTWRLASAIYCLNEWAEPDDRFADVDENPGPGPGRRTTSAWDQAPYESEEANDER